MTGGAGDRNLLLDGVLLYMEQERLGISQTWVYRQAETLNFYSDFHTVLDGEYRPTKPLIAAAKKWLMDIVTKDELDDPRQWDVIVPDRSEQETVRLSLVSLLLGRKHCNAILTAAEQGWGPEHVPLFFRSGVTVAEMQAALDSGNLAPLETLAALIPETY